jgi:RNA polymerase sigma factor (sigma-70 family)
MATGRMSEVLQHLRRTVLLREDAALTDGQLLEDYLCRQDDAALTALVHRHGSMVWGVCLRVLTNDHDAEDAFQATFLVLVRKAPSVVPRQMVANWLYGVAHQTALKARATAARRKGRERQVAKMPEPAVAEQDLCDDLLPLLDEELARLPDRYRAVLVLCDLEGKTRKEAACQLGRPEGTVAGWLARARAMLAKRLARRGITLSAGTLAAGLTHKAASAGVPSLVVSSTIKAASLFAAGHVTATGTIPMKVAALTEGVMKAMFFSRLKTAVSLALILGCFAAGTTLLAGREAPGHDEQKAAAEKFMGPVAKPRQGQENGASIAWGQVVNGLQAGLALTGARASRTGETVRLKVKLRNVGKAPVTITYGILRESAPDVTDANGNPVFVQMPPIFAFIVIPTRQVVNPGETLTLYNPEVTLAERRAGPLPDVYTPTIRVRVGKHRIGYTGMVQSHPTLATGTVELEVKERKQEAKADLENGRSADEKPDDAPRATVERYVSAALAGKADEAVKLAVQGASPQSPARKKRVAELATRVKARAIRFPTLYADAEEAIAVSEEVRLTKGQPDGTDRGFLVFAVVKSGGRWLVKDIDFRSAEGAKGKVEKFKKKHPDARSVPAGRADGPKAGASSGNRRVSARKVSIRFLGGAQKVPLGGLKVTIRAHTGDWAVDRKKTLTDGKADSDGTVGFMLEDGWYYVEIASDRELSYLNIPVGHKGYPGYYSRMIKVGKKTAFDFNLADACKLTLRAVDAATGKGIPGVRFLMESQTGEGGGAVVGDNLGADRRKQEAEATDKEGCLIRYLGPWEGYTYFPWPTPKGHEPVGDWVVTIPTPLGTAKAEHVFKFKKK